jgi:hypothetical protein
MYSNRGVTIRRGGGDEQSLYVNPPSLGRLSRGPDGRTSGRLSCSQLDGKTLNAEVIGELVDDRQAGPGADVSIFQTELSLWGVHQVIGSLPKRIGLQLAERAVFDELAEPSLKFSGLCWLFSQGHTEGKHHASCHVSVIHRHLFEVQGDKEVICKLPGAWIFDAQFGQSLLQELLFHDRHRYP